MQTTTQVADAISNIKRLYPEVAPAVTTLALQRRWHSLHYCLSAWPGARATVAQRQEWVLSVRDAQVSTS